LDAPTQINGEALRDTLNLSQRVIIFAASVIYSVQWGKPEIAIKRMQLKWELDCESVNVEFSYLDMLTRAPVYYTLRYKRMTSEIITRRCHDETTE